MELKDTPEMVEPLPGVLEELIEYKAYELKYSISGPDGIEARKCAYQYKELHTPRAILVAFNTLSRDINFYIAKYRIATITLPVLKMKGGKNLSLRLEDFLLHPRQYKRMAKLFLYGNTRCLERLPKRKKVNIVTKERRPLRPHPKAKDIKVGDLLKRASEESESTTS